MSLLASSALVAVSVLDSAGRGGVSAQRRTTASLIATREIEAIKAAPYSVIGLNPAASGYAGAFEGRPTVALGSGAGFTPSSSDITAGTTYAIERYITWRPVTAAGNTTVQGFKDIAVIVRWTEGAVSHLVRQDSAVTQMSASACTSPSVDSAPGTGITGVVNTYFGGTGSVSAGSSILSVGAPRGASTPIAPGDLLLVMQMQDATINSTNTDAYGDGISGGNASGATSLGASGRYEYVMATSVAASGTLSIFGSGAGGGLLNSYWNDLSGQPRRSFQVIRVPTYADGTKLASGLTAAAWDGSSGGVLAVDVAGTFNLNGGSASVDGLGFRGAGAMSGSGTSAFATSATSGAALKGEGIAGTPRIVRTANGADLVNATSDRYVSGDAGRGAPANAGGAAAVADAGGAGGAGAGAGGAGGVMPGAGAAFGGSGVAAAVDRLVMGGGGGAGGANTVAGVGQGGGGGGVVMIRASAMSGAGSISARGVSGPASVAVDGMGGGGGGGSVLIASAGAFGTVTATATGGAGTVAGSASSAAGGGGGGGSVITTATAIGIVTGGVGGSGVSGGAAGALGMVSSSASMAAIPGHGVGVGCIPVLSVSKSTSTPTVVNGSGGISMFTIVATAPAGRPTATNVVINDPLPTGFTYSATGLAVVLAGGASRGAPSDPTTGTSSPSWGSFTIPAGGSVSITYGVLVSASVAAGVVSSSAYSSYTTGTATGSAVSWYFGFSGGVENVTVTPFACAAPSTDVAPKSGITGVVNRYYVPAVGTVAAGATRISYSTTSGTGTLAPGDLVLVMQMQDAPIDSSNSASYGDGVIGSPFHGSTDDRRAGHYEYAMAVSGDAGGVISLTGSGVGGGLLYSYDQTPQTTTPRKSFQVIRVPTYGDGTSVDAGLTAAAWDGSSGGVLAFDIAGRLNLNGQSFGADGAGYRGAGDIAAGGKTDAYAAAVGTTSGALKGEGIAGLPEVVANANATGNVVISAKDLYPGGDAGFGGPGNAGGGGGVGQGGGGGAGVGDGGIAGSTATSAHGGAGVAQGVTRLVPGGGGGAGGRNGGSGVGFGGHGGGIVMLRAVALDGSGTASANGAAGVVLVGGLTKTVADSNGIGGGGGGGSVLISAPGGLGDLTATAIGGSPPNSGYSALQAGAGGGGGAVFVGGPATTDVSGGDAAQPTLKFADGALGSASTDLDPTQIPGTTLGVGCRPVITVDKTTSTPSVLRVAGTTATYTITIANLAGRPTAAGVTITDTLPAGATLSVLSKPELAGGATRTSTTNPTIGDSAPRWGTFTIPGGGSVAITVVAALPTTMAAGSTVENSASATDGATVAVQYASTQSTAEDVTAVAATTNLPLVSVQDASHPGGATDTGVATLTDGGTLTGVVNSYWPGAGTASRGATSITLGTINASGASTTIAAGDLLMVMQMQDATIDTSDTTKYGSGVTTGAGSGMTDLGETGVYEYVTALAAPTTTGGSTSVPIAGVGPSGGLLNSYGSAAATATRGQRTFQIVRVPQYSSATIGSGLTAAAWNGASGGVLAIDVSGALSLGSQTVNLTGLGFRGGANTRVGGGSIPTGYVATSAAGIKGEGVAGAPRYVATAGGFTDQGAAFGYPGGDYRRGAPGNAGGGGNSHNAGGGGGANGGVGGVGGVEWNSAAAAGGLGGAAFPAHSGRVVLGGGGGGGDANDRTGPNHQGGAGGGIAFIRAGSLSGTGTVTADGNPGTPTAPSFNDGGGGGGAGGSVIVSAGSGTSGLTVNARGGRGGAMYTNRLDGAGGGGGVVLSSGALAAATVTGGQPGALNSGTVSTATAGSAGLSSSITSSAIPGIALGRRADPTISGVVNTYFPGTGVVAAGSKTITVGASTGASTPIASGDMVLIMQMQAGLLNSTNTSSYGSGASSGNGSGMLGAEFSGRYEYAIATSAVSTSGGSLTVAAGGMGGGLINSYSTGAPSSVTPRYAFQVVRVPRYATATMGALDATAWNGSIGGVLAVDVPGTLALGAATINVSAKGFRGGGRVSENSGTAGVYVRSDGFDGQKGEGIAGTPRFVSDGSTTTDLGASWSGYPGGNNAMGAPANGGGGGTEHNAGGGGGANGGNGGSGGNGWTNSGNGGRGGAAVSANVDRVFLGGGGGSGDANNPCVTDGARGGGIVLVRAGALSGTGTITNNGGTANISGCNDGGGGGGAGGTVVVLAGSGTSGLTVQANGGRGASPSSGHGGGGGGGGGVVLTSGATAATTVTGGAGGTGSDAGRTGIGGAAGVASTSALSTSVPGATLDAVITARPAFGVPGGLSTFMPAQSAFASGNRIDVDLVSQFPTSAVALPGLANVAVKLQLTPTGLRSTACVYADLVRISTGSTVASGGALGTSSAPVCTSNGAPLDTTLSLGTTSLSGTDLNDLRLRIYARDSAGAGISVTGAHVTLDWQGTTGWVLSAGRISLNFLGVTAVLLDGGAWVLGDSAYTSTVVAPARTAPDRSVLLTFSGRTPPGATVTSANLNFGWNGPVGVCWWGELLSTSGGVTTTVHNVFTSAVPYCSTDASGTFQTIGLTASFLAVPDLQLRLHFSSADGTSVVGIDKAHLSATWTST